MQPQILAFYGHQDYFKRASEQMDGVKIHCFDPKSLPRFGCLKTYFHVLKAGKEVLEYDEPLVRRHITPPLLYAKVLGLKLKAAKRVSRLVQLLRDLKPEAVLIWNGFRFSEQCVRYAAKLLGIPVLYMENGLLPNSTTLDCAGINFENSVPRDPEFYRSRNFGHFECGDLEVRQPCEGKTIEESVDLPSKFIFAPFQVEHDSQIILFSKLISKMDEFVDYLVSAVSGTDFKVVFKEHPSSPINYQHIREKYSDSTKVVWANGNSTQQLICASCAVVTINSTVGIEAALFGKPVITMGQAFYTIPGVAEGVDSLEALSKVLNGDLSSLVDVDLRNRFFGYLKNDYLLQGGWRSPDDAHWQSFEKKLLKLLADKS